MRFVFAIIGIFLSNNLAKSETSTIELGWMNLPQCSKLEVRQVYNATYRFAEQRLYAYANYDSEQIVEESKNMIKTCVLGALAVCGGVSAALGNPSAMTTCMGPSTLTCVKAAAPAMALDNIHLWTQSRCLW
jgi:hypothetical protein